MDSFTSGHKPPTYPASGPGPDDEVVTTRRKLFHETFQFHEAMDIRDATRPGLDRAYLELLDKIGRLERELDDERKTNEAQAKELLRFEQWSSSGPAALQNILKISQRVPSFINSVQSHAIQEAIAASRSRRDQLEAGVKTSLQKFLSAEDEAHRDFLRIIQEALEYCKDGWTWLEESIVDMSDKDQKIN